MCLAQIFEELYSADGLTCMGRGLGIHELYCKFVQYYSSFSTEHGKSRKLVLCINANGYENAIRQTVFAAGSLFLPRVINSDTNSQERQCMYTMGGCFLVTSRILVVDILEILDPSTIDGILVYNAHRILESSVEAFALRVYRENNNTGFVKAFCADPEALQAGGSVRIEKLMKLLYLKRLYLWPRFHPQISQVLEANQPIVVEISPTLTNLMSAIQSALLVAMNTCLIEIKKSCPNLETAQFTLENGLYKSFDASLRYQLDQEYHKVSYRTKQLMGDMTVLRKLLDYLIRYDSFSFFYLLQRLQKASAEQINPALWLMSEAGNQIYRYAKQRVYSTNMSTAGGSGADTDKRKLCKGAGLIEDSSVSSDRSQLRFTISPSCECPPKWKSLLEILHEIKKRHADNAASQNQTQNANGSIILVVRDAFIQSQLKDVILLGADAVVDQRYRWFVSQQAAEIRQGFISKRRSSSSTNRAGPSRIGGARKRSFRKDISDDTPTISLAAKNIVIFDEPRDERPAGVGAADMCGDDDVVDHAAVASAADASGGGAAGRGRQSSAVKEDGSISSCSASSSSSNSTGAHRSSIMLSTDGNETWDYLGLGCSKEEFLSISPENQSLLVEELRMKRTPAALPNALKLSSVDSSILVPTVLKDVTASVEETGHYLGERESVAGGSTDVLSSAQHANSPDNVDTIIESVAKKPRVTEVSSEHDTPQMGNKPFFFSRAVISMSEDSATGHSAEICVSATLIDPNQRVLILTHSQWKENVTVLSDTQPSDVVLYDPDIAIIRSLEVYQASRRRAMHIYFLMIRDSTEIHRYAGTLAREKKTFEMLIRAKEQLVVSLPDNPDDLQREKAEDISFSSTDTRTIRKDMTKLKGAAGRDVVVDVREFRAALPSMLHATKFKLVPRTLNVGDYILSPTICIERKGISDLFQSFASGRLYNQAEAMGKHYRSPSLLIEFSPDKSFSLLVSMGLSRSFFSRLGLYAPVVIVLFT